MNYRLSNPLLDHRGDPIVDREVPLTLGRALELVLITGGKPDAKADDKIRQYKLACRVAKAKPPYLSLNAVEVKFIKELAAPLYSPIGLGALYEQLENPDLPDAHLDEDLYQ